MSEEIGENTGTRLAHVLFMDLVGYSRLPTDQQSQVSNKLKEIVRETEQVKQSLTETQLISLYTGDGMALVFFTTPLAPVECAAEISQKLRDYPEIKLRMGVHSGLVELIKDVNDKLNVAGGGINTAQRVMDCGDDGHILLSSRVADDLSQYSRWQPLLHDLGEVQVKHGASVHVFNLFLNEIGNPTLPEKFVKPKSPIPRIAAIVAAVLLVGFGIFYIGRQSFSTKVEAPADQRAESEFTDTFKRKRDAWVERVFTAQAADGGIKATPSADDNTVQTWATAQCLAGIFATGNNVGNHSARIKKAFDFIESARRTSPTAGWNLYGRPKDPYTITEVSGWVALAYIASLDSGIWTDAEKATMVNRIVRELETMIVRQGADGGIRPIVDDQAAFSRTYPTIVVLWALVEAKRSPAVNVQTAGKYDENIRKGINWLLRTYKEKQGWLQNPNRAGQVARFDGLTAQTLFVLSRAENIDAFAYLKNEPAYKLAKNEFTVNRQFPTWSIEKDNSSIPDGDIRFPGTDYVGEGSTFLWFPWTLTALTVLSNDQSLTAETRKAATDLRLDIIRANSERLENYVETGDFMYILGENLFCVSQYLNGVAK